MLKFIDVSTRLDDAAIQEVLQLAVGYPTPEKLAALARQYAREPMRSAFAFFDADAETHIDAVPFYRQCGFEVESLGELWPGVERFACRWRAPERSNTPS